MKSSPDNLNLPDTYIGHLMDRPAPTGRLSNEDVAFHIVDAAIGNGKGPITGPSEENNRAIAELMAAEALRAIRKNGASSVNWYTAGIDNALSIAALIHPELVDEDEVNPPFSTSSEARTVLFSALAITSQNIKVYENVRFALEQYEHFKEHGEFGEVGYGPKGSSVLGNLRRFNLALRTFGNDLTRLENFLKMQFTMGQMREVAADLGITLGGAELNDEIVHGSMIFGAKIGNGFLQNLMGNHQPITIDLWFMRMWGRYTGTLMKREVPGPALTRLTAGIRKALRSAKMTAALEEAGLAMKPSDIRELNPEELAHYAKRLNRLWERRRKQEVEKGRSNAQISEIKTAMGWPNPSKTVYESIAGTIDQPRNATERRWMREVTRQSVDILKDWGYEMTPADLQATLWYPEKELYGHLSGRDSAAMNVSYEQALEAAAKDKGFEDEHIARAVEDGAGRGRRPGHHGSVQRHPGRGGL